MAETTGIEWATASWNPWMGCHKVSAGCKNCYMFKEMTSYGRDPDTVVRSKTTFDAPRKWARSGKVAPGARIFTCSWSDWFIAEADEWRDDAWAVVRDTPQYTYLILTKRPERIQAHLPSDWGKGYPNVWLGVSTENQATASARIPLLLQTPAAVRFLSCEPLLGAVNLRPGFWIPNRPLEAHERVGQAIDWVIAGGESGPNARPMHPKWARDLRDQCQASGVPFFFKQWGEWIPNTEISDAGRRVKIEWSHAVFGRAWGCLDASGLYSAVTTTWNGRQYDVRDDYEVTMYRIGKEAAGRQLDGRTWDEFPA